MANHECKKEDELTRLHMEARDAVSYAHGTIRRVEAIEGTRIEPRLSMIENCVRLLSDDIPKIKTLLQALQEGQEHIFKQLGSVDDQGRRLKELEDRSRHENFKEIAAKTQAWRMRWQVMFGSLLLAAVVASMIYDPSCRSLTSPIVITAFCLGGAVFGPEWLRTLKELRGQK